VYAAFRNGTLQSLNLRVQLNRHMNATNAILPILYSLFVCVLFDRCSRLIVSMFLINTVDLFIASAPITVCSLGTFSIIFPLFCMCLHPAIKCKAIMLYPKLNRLLPKRVTPVNSNVDEGMIYMNGLKLEW
jgi:hypothetical protein